MLALTNAETLSYEYEPIPKSVYIEGVKLLSFCIGVSGLLLIFECITENIFLF